MVSLEKWEDGKHLLEFTGSQNKYSTYLKMIAAIKHKEYDVGSDGWIIDELDARKIDKLFKLNYFEQESVQEVKSDKSKKPISNDKQELQEETISLYARKSVENWDEMGKSLKLQPYDYQKETLKFIIDNKEALVVLPCGSGKTILGIAAYIEAIERNMIDGSGMIVVKASLKNQWAKEVEKFSDLRCTIIKTKASFKKEYNKMKTAKKILKQTSEFDEIKEETKKLILAEQALDDVFKEQFDTQKYDLMILNYETLNDDDVREQLLNANIQFIFADEIHYIKSYKSKRSKNLCQFNEVPIRIGATATPIVKDYEDLFGIFSFVKPDLFPKYSRFASQFLKFVTVCGRPQKAGCCNGEKLKETISNNVFVKLKEEVAKFLPKLTVIQRTCDYNEKQAKMHETMMLQIEDYKDQIFKLKSTLKTQQEEDSNEDLKKLDALVMATQTFAQELADSEELLSNSESDMAKQYVTGSPSAKIELCIDLIEEIIESGEKVAIFSKYERMQGILTNHINKHFGSDVKIAYVSGKLSSDQRYVEIYDKFRDTEEYKILLMSDAGAEGVNLNRCKYLIEFDLADSYAIQTQRHGRIERSDSIYDNAFVYQLIVNNSWDEVQQRIVNKKENFDKEVIKALV